MRRIPIEYIVLFIIQSVFITILVGTKLAVNHGDLTSFIVAGKMFVTSDHPYPLELTSLVGYDGQFYYRLALDPFNFQAEANGLRFDSWPAYRNQRIVYPLMASLFAFGQPLVIPAAMIVVNLLALYGITLVGVLYAKSLSRSPLWGLGFGMYFGFYLSLLRDLPEILAALFILSALLLIRRPVYSATLLTFATFTRETVLVIAGCLLIVAFIQRWHRWYIYLLPFILFGCWKVWLMYQWRSFPDTSFVSNFGLPFKGIIESFQHVTSSPLDSLFLFLLLVISVIFALSFYFSHAPVYIKFAWICYTVIALCLSSLVWSSFWGYLRILYEWYILGLMIMLSARPKSTYYTIKLPDIHSFMSGNRNANKKQY